MKTTRGLKRWVEFAVFAGVVQLLLPCTSVAEAQIVYACANKSTGELFKVASPGDCKKNQTPVSWNVQGPSGPPGPPASNAVPITGSSGFPVVITQPGSYILQANLTPPLNTDAIDIAQGVNNVTIDLNGFTISGSPTKLNVQAIGGSGNPCCNGVVVRNGTVIGIGIALSTTATIRNVVALNVFGSEAIGVHGNSIIENCTVTGSLRDGISCYQSNNCAFINNIASNNSLDGIACGGSSCMFAGNTTIGNSINGMSCSVSGCLFSGNVSNANSGQGIVAGDDTSALTDNVLNSNILGPFTGGTSLGDNLCNGVKC